MTGRVVCLLVGLLLSAATLAEDRLQLDETAIKGARELPKVLYIVPWKSARLGALVGGAGSQSLGVDWTALDHEEFRRQVTYFEMLYPDNGSPEVR